MRRHAGVSDFRRIGAQSLTWVEQAGLALTVANSTIFPGAFCWHVKGLFLVSEVPSLTTSATLGLGILGLTWFLSSLYLFNLYLTLF